MKQETRPDSESPAVMQPPAPPLWNIPASVQQRGLGFPGCRLELRSHHALSSLLSCLLPPPPFPLGRQATRPK